MTSPESPPPSAATPPGLRRGARGGRPATARQRRAAALVALLPDDAPVVRGALERLGKEALPALRRAARAPEPELRGRARGLLLDGARRRAAGRLVAFRAASRAAAGRETGGALLERGLWLLDRFVEPGRDVQPARRLLDEWAGDLANRIAGRPAGAQRALALVDLLGGAEGLAGAREDFHHPQHVSLSRSIERRAGLPLTLSAIYAGVARRAGLTAALLPFPGQVLLALEDGGERLIVDAAGGGKLLTSRQCVAHLSALGLPYRERWLRAATDGDMLARQARNLVQSLVQRRRSREVRLLQQAFGLEVEPLA